MVIMGILAGALFAGVHYARRSALESRATAELEEIRAALDDYFVEEGTFPAVLDTNSLALPAGRLRFSLGGVPLDPWGQDYQFTNMGLSYRVFSSGADKRTGPGAGDERARRDDIE
jgi:type II secretory pathway pseudopilin PulG